MCRNSANLRIHGLCKIIERSSPISYCDCVNLNNLLAKEKTATLKATAIIIVGS